MKKIILSLVFVLATGVTFINASSSNDESSSSKNGAIEVIEDLGCASDCVSAAKEGALWEEGEDADRSAGGALVQAFDRYYGACLATQC
jgi:hypothetical protein